MLAISQRVVDGMAAHVALLLFLVGIAVAIFWADWPSDDDDWPYGLAGD